MEFDLILHCSGNLRNRKTIVEKSWTTRRREGTAYKNLFNIWKFLKAFIIVLQISIYRFLASVIMFSEQIIVWIYVW